MKAQLSSPSLMRLTHGYREAVGLFALFLLLGSSTAQDVPYIPVDVNDLNPLDTCNRVDARMTVLNNTVYIYGGASMVRNGTSDPFWVLNHYLRSVDLTYSRDLNTKDILYCADLPTLVPVYQYGAFWADDRNLYAIGGRLESSPYLTESGQFLPTNWSYPALTANNIYHYDTIQKQWFQEPALPSSNGSAVTSMVSAAAYGWNKRSNTGYIYGGDNNGGSTQDYPNATSIPVTTDSITPLDNVVTFDSSTLTLENETAPMYWVEQGEFVSLPGMEDEVGGVLVAIGGIYFPWNAMVSMRQVVVYDSVSRTWYNQTTTAQDDEFPPTRSYFCAVAASASDSSSHNIYIYGGWQNAGTDIALDDIWVLSIPSFHWIPVGSTSVPKIALSCALLDDRYIVTYGGLPHAGRPLSEECDVNQSGLRLYDLTTSNWTNQYEASKDGYAVPSKIYDVIGGGTSGGATMTQPAAGFDTPALSSLFARGSARNSSPSVPSNTPPQTSTSSAHSGGSSNAGSIAGGVVGGVVGLAVISGAVYFIMRRKKKAARSEHTPELSPETRQARELSGRPIMYEMNGDHTYAEAEAEAISALSSQRP